MQIKLSNIMENTSLDFFLLEYFLVEHNSERRDVNFWNTDGNAKWVVMGGVSSPCQAFKDHFNTAAEITLRETWEIKKKRIIILTGPREKDLTCPENHIKPPKAHILVLVGREIAEQKPVWL